MKACLQNKKVYLMSHSRPSHFHPILILPLKMVELPQQHANTVHSLQALLLPIVAKSSILNIAEFLDSSLRTLLCTKTSPVLCEFQSFLLLFRNAANFIESHQVFLCYFLQHDEVFLISLLDGCYHYLVLMVLVNDCSKSKFLVRVNFIKMYNQIQLCISLIIFIIAVFYFD